jgi:hypothetical protein
VKLLELGASVTSEVMIGLSSSDEWPGTGEGLHGGRQRRDPGVASRWRISFRLIGAEALHAT